MCDRRPDPPYGVLIRPKIPAKVMTCNDCHKRLASQWHHPRPVEEPDLVEPLCGVCHAYRHRDIKRGVRVTRYARVYLSITGETLTVEGH